MWIMAVINMRWPEEGRPPNLLLFTLSETRGYVNFFSAIHGASEIRKQGHGRFIGTESNDNPL
jgi:hypothetical protein